MFSYHVLTCRHSKTDCSSQSSHDSDESFHNSDETSHNSDGYSHNSDGSSHNSDEVFVGGGLVVLILWEIMFSKCSKIV